MKKWGVIFITALTGAVLCYFVSALFLKGKGPDLFNARYSIRADLKHPYNSTHRGIPMEKITGQLSFRLENRKNKFRIERTGSDQADVFINRLADTNRIQTFIFNKGEIGFWETYQAGQVPDLVITLLSLLKPVSDSASLPNPPADSVDAELAALKKAVNNEESRSSQKPSVDIMTFESGLTPDFNTNALSPEIGYVFPDDTARVNTLLGSDEIRSLMPGDMTYAWGNILKNGAYRNLGRVPLYFLRFSSNSTKAGISNADILGAEYSFSPNERPVVNITFTKEGAAKWKNITGKNIGKYLAIQFDDLIISCPKVDSEIDMPSSVISGGFDVDEAIAFASEINTAPLLVPVEVKSIHLERAGGNFFGQPGFLALIGFLFFGGLAWFLFKALKNT